MTRVTCVQLAPRIGDLAGNLARAIAAVRAAVAGGADVVVLPELVTSGYVFTSVEETRSVAITPEHPVFAEWAQAAGGAVVVAGFAEAGQDRRLHNSAAVVDASGVRAVYRKVHLWDREKLFFTPGDALPPVVETDHGRIGVCVCYDLEFPEWTRTLALAGTDLLTVPTNWPRGPRPDGERPPEVIIAMGTARANRMAIAVADRAGVERGVDWSQGTSIIDAEGWVVATSAAEGAVVSADLDLAASRDKVAAEGADLFADRRPQLYGAVTRPG